MIVCPQCRGTGWILNRAREAWQLVVGALPRPRTDRDHLLAVADLQCVGCHLHIWRRLSEWEAACAPIGVVAPGEG